MLRPKECIKLKRRSKTPLKEQLAQENLGKTFFHKIVMVENVFSSNMLKCLYM